jgi:hypothetical protein
MLRHRISPHRLEDDMGTDMATIDEEQLGLYQTLAEAGPLTPSELAEYTSTAERYVREWLVTVFDALHDMGDPVGAAAHIHHSLAPDGTLLLVEPAAGGRRLREVVTAAGFGRFRHVAQTPFNLVYEADPDHGRTAPRSCGGVRQ